MAGLVVLAWAAYQLLAWRRVGFRSPRWVHVLAFLAFLLASALLWMAWSSGHPSLGMHSLLLVVFPAIVYVACGGAGASTEEEGSHIGNWRFAFGSGRRADGIGSANRDVRALCELLGRRVDALRTAPAGELAALPPSSTTRERIGPREVLLSTISCEEPGGARLIVVQAFMRSWNFPRYFSFHGVGHVYAEGLVVASDGTVKDADQEMLWQFR